MNKSIFILDDDEFFIDLISEMASGEYFYIQASSNLKLSDIAMVSEFDIIILDLYMPSINGLTVLEELSYHSTKPDIILVSGADQSVIDIARSKAQDWGITILGVLKKPFSIKDLKDMLEKSVTNSISPDIKNISTLTNSNI